ncbi:MAG: dicarboxylate/amino acid:cation symporter [Bacilli bacterium]|nr:dicarboxylate/amino acid:cation symporter [Bacilli bacterium]
MKVAKRLNNILIIISIVLAIILGLYFPKIVDNLAFIGTIYINLLKFMIIPIIFTSIMVSIYHSVGKKNKFIFKTILLFTLMFIVTFIITSLLVFLLSPGSGFSYKVIEWAGEVTKLNFQDIIINLFPSSIGSLLVNNSLFATIIFAIIFGFATTKVNDGKKLIDIIEVIKNVLYKIIEYIMYLTPLAIISLLGGAISKYGNLIFDMGFKYIGMAYLSSIITMIIVMILPAYLIGKVSPIKYIKNNLKVWLMTISTCSSVATLPVTLKTCEEDFKINKDVTSLTVPLGTTIHMCGGAVSFALLSIFCMQLFNMDITLSKYLLMIFMALIINMSAPGIPSGGIVIGATYLELLGIPLTFIGFYSSIYKLLDMAYTTLNVTGDITANIIMNKIYNKKLKS